MDIEDVINPPARPEPTYPIQERIQIGGIDKKLKSQLYLAPGKDEQK